MAVVGSRFRKSKGRLSKFRSLCSSFQGLMKVIRGGALPQGMYGAMVKGLDDRRVRSLRSSPASATFGAAR
eukprot:7912813-Pyramimonas_sp.AAC.1